MTSVALGRARSNRPAGARPAPTSPLIRRIALTTAAAAIVALELHLTSPYAGRATAALSRAASPWVAVALAAEVVSMLAAAQLQRRMLLATDTRVSLPTAVGLTYASTAMSVSLPAGPPVGGIYLPPTAPTRCDDLGAAFTLISSGGVSSLACGLVALAGFAVASGSSGAPLAVALSLITGGLLALAKRSLLHRPQSLERAGLRVLRRMNRVQRREPDTWMPELRRMLSSIRPRRQD